MSGDAEAKLRAEKAAAKEAIVRDRHLSRTEAAVGWKTVDAINTDPDNPLFGYSWYAADSIAEWIGPDKRDRPCNEKTVRTAWKRNMGRGHIVREPRGGTGQTDLYALPSDRASPPAQKEILTGQARPSERARSPGNTFYQPIQEDPPDLRPEHYGLVNGEKLAGWTPTTVSFAYGTDERISFNRRTRERC